MQAYRNFTSYKKHMFIKHRDVVEVSSREPNSDITESTQVITSSPVASEGEQEPYAVQ